MNVYAESSAVVAWLLGEPAAERARRSLAHADLVLASDLTLVECDRVLIRATALGEIKESEAADRRARLNAAAASWQVARLTPEIVERARRPFPMEPVRTLDALHLATALFLRGAVPGLVLLSLDDRIREVAVQLGLGVEPA